jgi:hypothetical protein
MEFLRRVWRFLNDEEPWRRSDYEELWLSGYPFGMRVLRTRLLVGESREEAVARLMARADKLLARLGLLSVGSQPMLEALVREELGRCSV